MCLFALLAGVFPRVAFAVFWIARPWLWIGIAFVLDIGHYSSAYGNRDKITGTSYGGGTDGGPTQ